MKPLYYTNDIRAIEQAAAAALPEGELMRRAGLAAASVALTLLAPSPSPSGPSAPAPALLPGAAPAPSRVPVAATLQVPVTVPIQVPVTVPIQVQVRTTVPLPSAMPVPVLILAGPGNNGGDALEVAAHLAAAGVQVTVWHVRPSGAQSPERLAALRRADSSAAVIIDASTVDAWSFDPPAIDPVTIDPVTIDALTTCALPSAQWQLVVDGLFGIGLARPIDGVPRALVDAVNALDCPVLALDVPSGLDADTGAIVGPAGTAIRASHTITFIGDKPGLHTNEGRDHAGDVVVAGLDLDPGLFPAAQVQLNHTGLFAHHLRARRHSSHKGTYGNVAVIGGGRGMRGAPILAARTALHAGAGRVYVLYPEDALPADSGQPELMCRLAEGYDLDQATLAIGPGLGDSATAVHLLRNALDSASALLVDADALNLLARDGALQTTLAARAQRADPAVLTPHPLEAARLLGTDVAGVQSDRLAAARTLASRLQSVVVLKGSGTVIAAPDGACVINPTGNPALATAGSGDVLSGLCASLLAQGWQPWPAALAAVWLHGTAADDLVAAGVGPIGMTAGELIPAIRAVINRLASRA